MYGALPYTGSVFTLPLFLIGLVLTAAGAIMRWKARPVDV